MVSLPRDKQRYLSQLISGDGSVRVIRSPGKSGDRDVDFGNERAMGAKHSPLEEIPFSILICTHIPTVETDASGLLSQLSGAGDPITNSYSDSTLTWNTSNYK